MKTRPSICYVWRRAQAGDGVAFGALALSAMRMHCSSLWRCRCVSIALVAAIGQTESRCAINKSCVRFKLIILDFSWFAQFDVSSGLGSGCAHADHLTCLVYIVCRSVSGINCETRSLVDFNHAWSLGFVDPSCLSGF